MSQIMTRQAIAAQADAAAARWIADPSLDKPTNPYDRDSQPDHFAAWRASFERSLLARSAPTAEGSA